MKRNERPLCGLSNVGSFSSRLHLNELITPKGHLEEFRSAKGLKKELLRLLTRLLDDEESVTCNGQEEAR